MQVDRAYRDVAPGNPLRLHRATTVWARLRGLHAYPGLSAHQGLFIAPCRAIHTLCMRYPIDVVFLDGQLNVLKRVDSLMPYRVTMCRNAAGVVELPAGYCLSYPDYPSRIRLVLTDMSAQSSL